MNCRPTMARLLVCTMVSAMTPVGCGGTQEEPYYPVDAPTPPNTTEAAPTIQVPDATVREVKACVDKLDYHGTESSHAFQYNLGANDLGTVADVTLRDTTLRDTALERCFERALSAMVVPKDALKLRSSKPFSGGESMSLSRAEPGFVQALAAPIALVPIFITALGVTIIVAVSIEIIRNATSRPDCKRIKEECIEYCSDTTLPTSDFGWKFQNCKNECLEKRGCPRAS